MLSLMNLVHLYEMLCVCSYIVTNLHPVLELTVVESHFRNFITHIVLKVKPMSLSVTYCVLQLSIFLVY